MKILIIEDEYSLADAIAETLNKENFTVEIITDGQQGEDEALILKDFIVLINLEIEEKKDMVLVLQLPNQLLKNIMGKLKLNVKMEKQVLL